MIRLNDIRFGRSLRALRHRLGWRQIDVARKAATSQQLVSLLELGGAGKVSVPVLRRVAAALGATVDLDLRWRGGELDRLIDARHASLAAKVSTVLVSAGWQVFQEFTFNEFGERGSIDVLGLRHDIRAAIVIEVKGDVTSWEAAQRAFDVKVRLLPKILERRVGWRPRIVGRSFVIDATMTNRRRIKAGGPAMRQALPANANEIRAWLAKPTAAIAGIWFTSAPLSSRLGARRIRLKAA